jgi:hypothetical protein
MELSLTSFVIASLAVWRMTHLLNAEHGPWDLGVKLRQWAGPGQIGQALTCFYCLSFWVALPFVPWLTLQPAGALVVWFALSGAAILLQRVSDPSPPPAAWHEEELPPP